MRGVLDIVKCQVGDETQHNTKGGPHLPHHDEGATNGGGGTLGGIDGDGSRLGTNAETEDKTSDLDFNISKLPNKQN